MAARRSDERRAVATVRLGVAQSRGRGRRASQRERASPPERRAGRLAQPGLTWPRVCRNARAIVAAQPAGSLSAGRAPAPRTRTKRPAGSSAASLRSVDVGARDVELARRARAPAPRRALRRPAARDPGSPPPASSCRPARPSARRQVAPLNGPPSTCAAGAGAASSWQELASGLSGLARGRRRRGRDEPRERHGIAVQRGGRGARQLCQRRERPRAPRRARGRRRRCGRRRAAGASRSRAARRATTPWAGPSAFASACASARAVTGRSSVAGGPPSSTRARSRSACRAA